MLKIAIATNSAYKVHAIKSVLHALNFEFEAVFDKVDSGISEQPMQKGETRRGSENRAKNILKRFPEANIGLGVEFGYEPDDEAFKMICWASICTKDCVIFSEHSSSLELPKVYLDAILKNINVDDILEENLKTVPDTQTGLKFKIFIKKRKVIYECVENVMLRYLMREHY